MMVQHAFNEFCRDGNEDDCNDLVIPRTARTTEHCFVVLFIFIVETCQMQMQAILFPQDGLSFSFGGLKTDTIATSTSVMDTDKDKTYCVIFHLS